jgi:rare lipoprotein A (peptidoglycan hydrolase)
MSGPLAPDTFASLVSQDQFATDEAATKTSLPADVAAKLAYSDAQDEALPPTPHKVTARDAVEAEGYTEVGLASWYGSQFQGRPTANGETFNRLALTAAHLSLPLPSYVRVTNLDNNRSITVRVNDRGPYTHNRLIDVSEQTAELLAFRRHGLTKVRVDYLGPAPVDTDDGQMLLASYRAPADTPTGIAQPGHLPQPTRVAFADEASTTSGEGAMEELTTRPSVMDRILMAFNAATFTSN